MSGSLLACAAIVGKDNEPLYLRSFVGGAGLDEEHNELRADPDGLKWHFYVHSALDVVEEKRACVHFFSKPCVCFDWIGKLWRSPMPDFLVYVCAS